MEQANMVPGQEMDAIQVLASRNFFPPNMLEGGNSYNPNKKLHLGYEPTAYCKFQIETPHTALRKQYRLHHCKFYLSCSLR